MLRLVSVYNKVMKIVCIMLIVGIICLVKICAEDQFQGHAIQIVAHQNNSLQLQLNVIKPILEADDIKDRYIVVVSIVGIPRTGKSFLMNYFIRFLNVQVMSLDFENFIYFDLFFNNFSNSIKNIM